ncbi:hypothetical protein [Shewanella waksmanii]|uniref:hypothetical protein n=1 Tax=Shewanella waksmanii TaxID=213783 RepID=UPI0037354570
MAVKGMGTQTGAPLGNILASKMRIDTDPLSQEVNVSSYQVHKGWLDDQDQLQLIESYMHEEDA